MQNTDIRCFDLTQRTVFGLLAQTLFGAAYTPEPNVDWPSVYMESECQAVRLQTFANHHRIPDIPEDLRTQLRQYVMGAMLKDARIHAQHTALHMLFTEHNIPYSILKGASSAYYYANPLTRAMGDVDFYVDKVDLERAIAVLRADGYEVEDYHAEKTQQYHLGVRKGIIHMEMHYMFPGVPEGRPGEIILSYLSDIRETTFLLQNELVTCRLPSPFNHGLIMLMHLHHHLLCEGIGLRHLCDWAVFVNRFSEEEFQSLFRERLTEIGLWHFARLLSLASSLYVGLPEQSWMREDKKDDATAFELMNDIIRGGNFGIKDRQRVFEGKFISNRGKNGVRRNRLSEAVASVNASSRERWPIMGKLPILLPIGWILGIFRYLFHNSQRRKTGKQIHIVDAYRNSESRKKLYRKLRLYEPDKKPKKH